MFDNIDEAFDSVWKLIFGAGVIVGVVLTLFVGWLSGHLHWTWQ